MLDSSTKIELVKIHFVLIGAVFSAIKFGFDYDTSHVFAGTFLLAVSVSLLYLSLMPEFYFTAPRLGIRKTEYYQRERMDLFIFISFAAFVFLFLGFALPTLTAERAIFDLSPDTPDTNRGALLPYVLAGLVMAMRTLDLRAGENRTLTRMYGLHLAFVCLLLSLVWFLTQTFLAF